MSNINSENSANSSKAEILQEKEVELAICQSHLRKYRLILSRLEEFLEGEKPFNTWHPITKGAISFNCGCCTWSRCLRTHFNAKIREYFKSVESMPTQGYEIFISDCAYLNRVEQYAQVACLDQPPYNTYKFPELPNWMQQYLLKRLEHATALLAIYEAGIKKLEEEIKHGRAS